MQTTVTKRGQTVIPSDIRKKYHISEGDQLIWIEYEGHLKVIPVPKDAIAALRGSAKGSGLSKKLLIARKQDRDNEN